MSIINNIIKNLKQYRAEDLSVVFVQKVANVREYNQNKMRIVDYDADFDVFVTERLKQQSTDRFERYYLLTQEKIVDQMPCEYYNKGDKVVTRTFPFVYYCKNMSGTNTDPSNMKFSMKEIEKIEENFKKNLNKNSKVDTIK